MKLLVTGGAGFIGSNFIRYMLKHHDDVEIVVLDKLTYAGNLDNHRGLEQDARYRFVRGDICDSETVEPLAADCQAIVNFAAETHVDRSLLEPGAFITTDVYGTYILLEAARRFQVPTFIQISTDEVYGSVETGSSVESDVLEPRSPYSASKAGAEMMVRAYHVSYGVPVIITRGSNNFGPYQYPEKLISLFSTNALDDEPLPIYGDGMNVRDWIYVEDHCSAIDFLLTHGKPGETYNVGGGNERTNLEVTKLILRYLNKPESLIQYISDRPGHDRRYSMSCSKLQSLGWRPEHGFEESLEQTVCWYRENEGWWRKIKSGEFADYYRRNYAGRQLDESP
ncbi:MAG: dTDP-glucose 4,6-dehydratase [Armatimonadetes bacterium]|nr:dTDP-glucose 4,6-dehydratase [Armatimonadota bacterium]